MNLKVRKWNYTQVIPYKIVTAFKNSYNLKQNKKSLIYLSECQNKKYYIKLINTQ